MGTYKTMRSKSQGIPLNQQGADVAPAGKFRHGLALLLTALLVVSIWISPAAADVLPTDCTICHGTFVDVHGSVTHQATPGSGAVTLFPDNGHDDAGWTGPQPYFAVTVNCVTCHNTYLPEVHSNDCSVCHPSPYDTLSGCGQAGWGGGCQQGGCHTVFHADTFTAHEPFEDSYDPTNDCYRCHTSPSDYTVPQANCLNCHATPVTGYGSPPLTTSDAQGAYNGAAEINFMITESGNKVGIGRTFYKLDGADPVSNSKVVVSAGGSHDLEFWSVDQYGVSEVSHNTVYFTVTADTTPPTTTSNAQALYYQGANITLMATDDSATGVKNTYYTLNGGLAQTGTTVNVPATPGNFNYTLVFWSVDWSGNIETQHSVNFTVKSGNGTIKLVWWDSDTVPAHAPVSGEHATWQIRRGGPTGYLAASGSGVGGSGWNGINTYTVPVRPEQYYVYIFWETADDAGDQEEYVDIMTNGDSVTINY
jgi:hypothetical protein